MPNPNQQSSLPDIHLNIIHNEIRNISDRTLQMLLKGLSKVLRLAQREEIDYLINIFEATEGQKQSLRDRMHKKITSAASYDLLRLEKGSIELVIALTAVGVWLLQTTLGESIKDAWTQTKAHKKIVDFLKSGDRNKRIADRILQLLHEKNVYKGRFIIQSVKMECDNFGKRTLTIQLKTPDDLQKQLPDSQINGDFVLKEGERRIRILQSNDSTPASRTVAESANDNIKKPKAEDEE
jgi:hypothetical protein